MAALSVSTINSGSSLATASPSRLSHSVIVPSSMVRPRVGMITSVGIVASGEIWGDGIAAQRRHSSTAPLRSSPASWCFGVRGPNALTPDCPPSHRSRLCLLCFGSVLPV
jgi:hypothetical protein